MTLLVVVQEVCTVVGVNRPTSVFSNITNNRTMLEMLAVANEMAQRIAWDTREWTALTIPGQIFGDGVLEQHPLPANFRRMTKTANVRRTSTPTLPMRFFADYDEWLSRRMRGYYDPRGEWIINDNRMWIVPTLAAGDSVRFPYLDQNHINRSTGGVAPNFANDNDTFILDERLLKLGMIWQWKAQKGTPYAEDMSNYEDALARVAGSDSPAPIIVGVKPISAVANVAFPWPPDWGSVTR